jgi:hypothetical protein
VFRFRLGDVALPKGLRLDRRSGAIFGVPEEATPLTHVPIQCVCLCGTLVVTAPVQVSFSPPAIEYPPRLVLSARTALESLLPRVEGPPAQAFAAEGLPEGLLLDPATGRLHGEPRELCQDRAVRVQVTSSAGTSTTEFLVTVAEDATAPPTKSPAAAEDEDDAGRGAAVPDASPAAPSVEDASAVASPPDPRRALSREFDELPERSAGKARSPSPARADAEADAPPSPLQPQPLETTLPSVLLELGASCDVVLEPPEMDLPPTHVERAEGALPPGFSLKDGVLRCTPRECGKFSLVVLGAAGARPVRITVPIEVVAPEVKAPVRPPSPPRNGSPRRNAADARPPVNAAMYFKLRNLQVAARDRPAWVWLAH